MAGAFDERSNDNAEITDHSARCISRFVWQSRIKFHQILPSNNNHRGWSSLYRRWKNVLTGASPENRHRWSSCTHCSIGLWQIGESCWFYPHSHCRLQPPSPPLPHFSDLSAHSFSLGHTTYTMYNNTKKRIRQELQRQTWYLTLITMSLMSVESHWVKGWAYPTCFWEISINAMCPTYFQNPLPASSTLFVQTVDTGFPWVKELDFLPKMSTYRDHLLIIVSTGFQAVTAP